MPRAGADRVIWHEPRPYFDTLAAAHEYARAHNDTPVTPRWPSLAPGSRLLVCHDFKGGYIENEQERGYTLEHWENVDAFVYFSHHRVSLPPAQWIRAAHENNTAILGTLIFEWDEAQQELALLLGPAARRMYVSVRVADMLIELALQRGFQGYLINVEVPLNLSGSGGPGGALEAIINAERLRKWVEYLQRRGAEKTAGISAAGETAWVVVWYDSVVHPHGRIAYQNALMPANAAFFAVSTALFTNYAWTAPRLADSRIACAALGRDCADILVGVDVFGRSGAGGLDTPAALELIGPRRGAPDAFSAALFAPGWTWEHREQSWADWWALDTAFWEAVTDYFPKRDERVAFATNFCKGSGDAWFVRGERVHAAPWTDMAVCAPKSLAWPKARALHAATHGPTPVATSLAEDTVWSGNSALRITTEQAHEGVIVPLACIAAQDTERLCVTLVAAGGARPVLVQHALGAVQESTHGAWTRMTASFRPERPVLVAALLPPGVHAATIGYIEVAAVDAGEHDAAWNEQHGLLTWSDFAPWTSTYEIFAIGDATHWLGTALARTSAAVVPPPGTSVLEVRAVGSEHAAYAVIA